MKVYMKNTDYEFDFHAYDDIVQILAYDGFIRPDGLFYKVRKSRSNSPIDHYLWAEAYLEKYVGLSKISSNISGSLLLRLTQMNSYVYYLVDFLGFVYYSHDQFTRGPIILAPNEKVNNKRFTKEQEDTLFNIMYIKGEDVNNPVLNREQNTYVASDEGRKK